MDLKAFILPTKLDNTDENQEHGNRRFATEDYVYLESVLDVKDDINENRITYPTDYAVLCGAMLSGSNTGPEARKSCWTWLRSASSAIFTKKINFYGDLNYDDVH